MTQTSNQTLTDVHDMVVVHRVFRRELRLIPQLVREVAPGDTARAPVLAAQGTPDEVRRSTDPLVHQFVCALPDGPVQFHYPGVSVEDDFGPVQQALVPKEPA